MKQVNAAFINKLNREELAETLFFATGTVPTKTKNERVYTLTAPNFTVVLKAPNNIRVNGERAYGRAQAKRIIQDFLQYH